MFLEDTFLKYNKLAFNGELILPSIRLVTARRYLGRTVLPCENGATNDNISGVRIEINVRYDLPEDEWISTLVHEMIHYYIWYKGLLDDSVHGCLFHKYMNYINSTFEVNVTVAVERTDDIVMQEPSRLRYVCIVLFDDSSCGVMVAANNKLFDLWRAFDGLSSVSSVTWFASVNPYFGELPVSVSPRLLKVPTDDLMIHLNGAKELENVGTEIRLKEG